MKTCTKNKRNQKNINHKIIKEEEEDQEQERKNDYHTHKDKRTEQLIKQKKW